MGLAGHRCVLTGLTGAVGSAVAARLLASGMALRAVVRRPAGPEARGLEQAVADLADRAALGAAVRGADLAVHCAAALSSDLALCRATNVEGTRNLVDALVGAGCRRLVHISSVSVYEPLTGADIDEDGLLGTDARYNPYGVSKAEAEVIVTAAAARLETVILRPVPVLSLHARSFWGPMALQRARAGMQPLFACREFPHVHVENLAAAVELALASPAAVGRAYNVQDGVAPTATYLEAVASAIGSAAPLLPPDAPVVRFASARIRRELGYAPPDRFLEFVAGLRGLREPGRSR